MLTKISKQQRIVLIGFIILMVFGLALALILTQREVRLTPRAAEHRLRLALENVPNDPSDPANIRTIAVIANPVSDPGITFIQVHIKQQIESQLASFNTDQIEVVGIQDGDIEKFPGWSIPSPEDTMQIVQNKGFIKYLLFTTSVSRALTQRATLFKIKFQIKTDQPITTAFDVGADKTESFSETNRAVVEASNITFNEQTTNGATLKLVPASGSINAGDTLSVDIVLDTNGNGIAGVETIIEYDKILLSITSKDQIIPAPDIPDNPYPDDFDRGSYVIQTGLSSSDPINKGRLSVNTIIPVDSSDGLNRQNILVARINFSTTAGTNGTPRVEYLCTPLASTSTCNPNPTDESYSLVAAFDDTKANNEGNGILTRVENGAYEITQPGTTPTITPNITPTPTVTVSPPTPTATVPPPSPTLTPQPGQARLLLALNACSVDDNDNLSRTVVIKIGDSPQQEIAMNRDGTTDLFTIPAAPFTLKVMPIGHLPATFQIEANDINPVDKTIDRRGTRFIGGNSDSSTGNTGATDLSFTGVVFDDTNRDLDAQIINIDDFHAFKRWDMGKTIAEDPKVIRSDFNCSGKVNVLDYSSILLHWGEKTSN